MPVRLLQHEPDALAEASGKPLQVIAPVLLDIANSRELNVGTLQQAGDLADGLRTEADVGKGNLVAGRNMSPAQNGPGNDGECRGGGAASPRSIVDRGAMVLNAN
jgi:hypothetical protein